VVWPNQLTPGAEVFSPLKIGFRLIHEGKRF